MHHFVVRQRQDEVFVERVDQAERQLVVMKFAVDRIVPHVARRVVHPAHVPFQAESKSADVSGRDTPAQAVDSSAIVMMPGYCVWRLDVELLQEIDGFEVFAAAKLVGIHSPGWRL